MSRLGSVDWVVKEVEAGTRRLLVYTLVSVLVPLIVITVVIYCCVRLLTDPNWAAVASDASVKAGLEELVVVDWTPSGVGP